MDLGRVQASQTLMVGQNQDFDAYVKKSLFLGPISMVARTFHRCQAVAAAHRQDIR